MIVAQLVREVGDRERQNEGNGWRLRLLPPGCSRMVRNRELKIGYGLGPMVQRGAGTGSLPGTDCLNSSPKAEQSRSSSSATRRA